MVGRVYKDGNYPGRIKRVIGSMGGMELGQIVKKMFKDGIQVWPFPARTELHYPHTHLLPPGTTYNNHGGYYERNGRRISEYGLKIAYTNVNAGRVFTELKDRDPQLNSIVGDFYNLPRNKRTWVEANKFENRLATTHYKAVMNCTNVSNDKEGDIIYAETTEDYPYQPLNVEHDTNHDAYSFRVERMTNIHYPNAVCGQWLDVHNKTIIIDHKHVLQRRIRIVDGGEGDVGCIYYVQGNNNNITLNVTAEVGELNADGTGGSDHMFALLMVIGTGNNIVINMNGHAYPTGSRRNLNRMDFRNLNINHRFVDLSGGMDKHAYLVCDNSRNRWVLNK